MRTSAFGAKPVNWTAAVQAGALGPVAPAEQVPPTRLMPISSAAGGLGVLVETTTVAAFEAATLGSALLARAPAAAAFAVAALADAPNDPPGAAGGRSWLACPGL